MLHLKLETKLRLEMKWLPISAILVIRDQAKTRDEMASEMTPGTWVIFKSDNGPVQAFWLGKTISKCDWGNECIWLNNTRGGKDVEGAQIAAGTYAINVQWYALKDASVPLKIHCGRRCFDKTINQVFGSRVWVSRKRTIRSNRG